MIRNQRAGNRSELLTVQRATPSQGDYGDTILSWATVASIRGSMQTPSARERLQGGKVIAECDCVFEFNKKEIPGLLQADRILNDGKTYEISGITYGDSRQQFFRVACKALR